MNKSIVFPPIIILIMYKKLNVARTLMALFCTPLCDSVNLLYLQCDIMPFWVIFLVYHHVLVFTYILLAWFCDYHLTKIKFVADY